MSLDLDWTLLDAPLSAHLISTLNRALATSSSSRPSFLGDVHLASLDFGTQPPDVTIRHIGDIWSDFIHPPDHDHLPSPPPAPAPQTAAAADGYDAASVRTIPVRSYTHFHDEPLKRVSLGSGAAAAGSVGGVLSSRATTPLTPHAQWSLALASRGIGVAGVSHSEPASPGYFGAWPHSLASSRTPSSAPFPRRRSTATTSAPLPTHSVSSPPSSIESTLPSLQLHFSLYWPTTTFRLTIHTSLLINYPSPAFMELPLTLSITGFVMRAGLIVALEGEKRRAHVCLTQEEDDADQLPPNSSQPNQTHAHVHAHVGRNDEKEKRTKGAAILPALTFESEVGQADKHALRNVGKVERFVAELVRKAIEDELVFPNYYTIDLPQSS
ncbi:Mitochondrial distribution and morphology protein 12 [Thecaphora frezii]